MSRINRNLPIARDQQLIGLVFADDGYRDGGSGHVDVQDSTHQESNGGCESGVGFHHLWRLLLNDESTRHQISQRFGDPLQQLLEVITRLSRDNFLKEILQLLIKKITVRCHP